MATTETDQIRRFHNNILESEDSGAQKGCPNAINGVF